MVNPDYRKEDEIPEEDRFEHRYIDSKGNERIIYSSRRALKQRLIMLNSVFWHRQLCRGI